MDNIIPEFNILAVLVAGAAYWLLGALWFSLIAGNAWSTELTKHGVTIKEPTRKALVTKLIITYLLNTLVAFGVSLILWFIGIDSVDDGIIIGLILGVCFAAAVIGITYTWESRSLKLFLIDAAYPVLGITICAIICSLWQ
jgi:hypothetical protein